MTLEERIKYAEQRRDDAFCNGSLHNLTYWNGYIAALKAVEEDKQMNKEKQIEEMAKDINIADHEYCRGQCIGCEHKPKRIEDCACIDIAIATGLTDKGYRKASEVIGEIIEELTRYLRLNEDIALKCKEENGEQNREYFKGKLSAFKQIRGFIDVELKKECTEEGK